MPREVMLLATRSEGKRRELLQLLEPLGVDVLTLEDAGIAVDADEESLERFETFEENAVAKARHFHARSGLATIADDSGLEVRALGLRPGVRSKRWSGRPELTGRALDDANNALLLATLRGHEDRRARFVCAVAFVAADVTIVRRGETEGRILHEPAGTSGFGYDPLFLSTDLARAFGELSREEKATVSHRGRALRALRDALAERARASADRGA
jgi:XTP/dITP diphosphohydrolase